jgi:hypothetical protein
VAEINATKLFGISDDINLKRKYYPVDLILFGQIVIIKMASCEYSLLVLKVLT